ncbi:methyltransferase domain-containing protein [Streptomyces sp. NPDC012623]|uniref:methyltransferase domain-containing protein n=1 Tax=unclassified Streptomyces TaxID=2593676 RepID=UPI0036A652A1
MTAPAEPADLDALRARTAAQLDAAGGFEQPWMRAAFEKVARHAFVPRRVWEWHQGDRAYKPLDRAEAPDDWARLVYDATGSVVTQVDDGRPGPHGGALPTSSISAPDAVFTMLAAADVHPGQRILEIGAGTGYNAALLCERAGAENVTTVEIDPTVAEGAEQALRATGYRPVLVVADGEKGCDSRAPFDRVISTASLSRVPGAWIAQTRPGGLVVAPWRSALQPRGMAVLRITEEGRGEGHFGYPMAFMDLRGQRRDDHSPLQTLYSHDTWTSSRAGTTTLDMEWLDTDFHARFAVGLMLPGLYADRQDTADGSAWWLSTDTSWAHVAETEIRQWGPRDLVADLEQAYRHWTQAGRPDLYEYGLTVTADGSQHPWLRTPDQPFRRRAVRRSRIS